MKKLVQAVTENNMNILWITCDEMKAKAIRPYANKYVPVPAIERIASEGVIFMNNFVQVPKCIPSRPSMLSSRYPHLDGLRTMSTESFNGTGWMTLSETSPNLLKWLKEKKYRTAIFGKNHWIRPEAEQTLLDRFSCAGDPFPKVLSEPEEILHRAYFGNTVDPNYDRKNFVDELSVSEAIKFMNESKKQNFCVLLDISQPHPPYFEWPEFADDIPLSEISIPSAVAVEKAPIVEQAIRKTFDVENLSDEQKRKIIRAYWSQCRYADSLIKRVLDFLETSKLVKNTFLIITSDHGDFAGEHNCYEKWDTSFLDCIVHVPLLMRFPGILPKSLKINSLTEHVDIVPTILEIMNQNIPATVNGKSLLPLMKNPYLEHKKAVFSQGGVEPNAVLKSGTDYRSKLIKPYWNKQKTIIDFPETLLRSHMVRTKTYKLIYRLSGDHELYNLVNDPDEINNIYKKPGTEKILSEMKDLLLDFFVQNQTQIPVIEELWA